MYAYSGRDGAELYSVTTSIFESSFGHHVSGTGDVNGDGVGDFVAGAPVGATDPPPLGTAFVYSGFDGTLLFSAQGTSEGARFGSGVGGAGDVNGDGFADVVIGSNGDGTNGPAAGAVYVLSGTNGTTLYAFFGDASGDFLGTSVDGAGDVNADGVDDVIAGATGTNGRGSARVYSGLDGSVLYTFHGDTSGETFGSAVSAAEDIDADGFADVIVGARLDNDSGMYAGSARVFSGFDGSALYTFYGDAHDVLGSAVADAGDIDGDGRGDLIVGAPGGNVLPGYARVFSGRDGSELVTYYGEFAGDDFGASVVGAGDVTMDGRSNVLVGAPSADGTFLRSGLAYLFGCSAVGTIYCSPALPNSTAFAASIRACGSERVAADDLLLAAEGVPPGEFGYFLASRMQGFVNPPGSAGILCLMGNIGRYNQLRNLIQGPEGSIRLQLASIPVNPPSMVIVGDTWNFQCWFRDGATSNFTDAVSVLFR
ncbi:MAG: hypothetical protein GY711_07665 [bacterium]|nr:hypothetical protein [bacterium]